MQDVKARRTQAVQWIEDFFAKAEVVNNSEMRTAARQLTDADVARMVKELR